MKSTSRMAGPTRSRCGMAGVTLLELMVVVVVVGILAAIAYPSFQEQVRKTKRADGKAALMEAAQELERCYTRFASYTAAGCGVALPRDSGEGHYVVDFDASAAASFTLSATPQDDQVNDTCGTLTLTNAGVQGADADPDDCW